MMPQPLETMLKKAFDMLENPQFAAGRTIRVRIPVGVQHVDRTMALEFHMSKDYFPRGAEDYHQRINAWDVSKPAPETHEPPSPLQSGTVKLTWGSNHAGFAPSLTIATYMGQPAVNVKNVVREQVAWWWTSFGCHMSDITVTAP